MTTEQRALTREEALDILRAHRAELRERFGVVELALFGSTVRNEARPDSDVDLLVTRRDDYCVSWRDELPEYVGRLLQRKVDLVDRRRIFAKLRPYIEREALDVFNPPQNWSLPVAVPKRWDIYIDNMLEHCRAALEFTDGLDQQSFSEQQMAYMATLHAVQTIGEAANKVPRDVQQAHPEIPWKRLIDDRKSIVHEYYHIEPDEVWSLVSDALPQLIPRLEALRSESEPEAPP